ncbi:MAG: hypothetical protein KUA38_14265, partial [Hydrogenophaga sp.]|nr:hypothetical protein [Hydrogenophaga sp.]
MQLAAQTSAWKTAGSLGWACAVPPIPTPRQHTAQKLWDRELFRARDGVGGAWVVHVISATLAENRVLCCDFLHNLLRVLPRTPVGSVSEICAILLLHS